MKLSPAAKLAADLIADYIPGPISRSLKKEITEIVQSAIEQAQSKPRRPMAGRSFFRQNAALLAAAQEGQALSS